MSYKISMYNLYGLQALISVSTKYHFFKFKIMAELFVDKSKSK